MPKYTACGGFASSMQSWQRYRLGRFGRVVAIQREKGRTVQKERQGERRITRLVLRILSKSGILYELVVLDKLFSCNVSEGGRFGGASGSGVRWTRGRRRNQPHSRKGVKGPLPGGAGRHRREARESAWDRSGQPGGLAAKAPEAGADPGARPLWGRPRPRRPAPQGAGRGR